MTTIDYAVIDCHGNEWARYCYAAMAQAVAGRNNADAAMAAMAPFTVTQTSTRYGA